LIVVRAQRCASERAAQVVQVAACKPRSWGVYVCVCVLDWKDSNAAGEGQFLLFGTNNVSVATSSD